MEPSGGTGIVRRRQKLEPPSSGAFNESGASDDRRSRRKSKLKSKDSNPCLGKRSSFAKLTRREWTLVLATAILVYGGCGGGRVRSLFSKDDYSGYLAARGDPTSTTFGDGVGTGPRPGSGGHPRDPPYLREFSSNDNRRRRLAPQKAKSHERVFAPVPEAAKKTFFYDNQKISMPVIRALRSRGWKKVDEVADAQMIYTYKQMEELGEDLERWQRFNLIPNAYLWNDKWSFVQRYKEWEAEQINNDETDTDDDGSKKNSDADYSSVYVPESYMLTGVANTEERLAFARRLDRNGADHPWVLKEGDVNQGRGITILAPNSPELLEVPYRFEREEEERKFRRDQQNEEEQEYTDDEVSDVIVQKYVCNEMTWNKRKFDVRVFWLVASLDPLVVLYHDGYVRIGNADYSETDFSDTKKHLTTHTKLGAEGKATWDEFAAALEVLSPPTKVFPESAKSPVEHVRNQMKEALAEMIERFRDVSFVPNYEELPTDNSYSFYCADFILDNDLDAWFLEPQFGCGLDEDYYFRLEMHASLFNGMADVLEEIWTKEQEPSEGLESPSPQASSSTLLPLQHQGNWEVIYLGDSIPTGKNDAGGDDDGENADALVGGKAFRYPGYTRSRDKEGCDTKRD